MTKDSRVWDIAKWLGQLIVVIAGVIITAAIMHGNLKALVSANTVTIEDIKDRTIRIENFLIGEPYETPTLSMPTD